MIDVSYARKLKNKNLQHELQAVKFTLTYPFAANSRAAVRCRLQSGYDPEKIGDLLVFGREKIARKEEGSVSAIEV